MLNFFEKWSSLGFRVEMFYKSSDKFTYLAMANKGVDRKLCFSLLDELQERFLAAFTPQQRDTALPFSLNSEFWREIKTLMVRRRNWENN
jgi:Regulated-SNARE-like domain